MLPLSSSPLGRIADCRLHKLSRRLRDYVPPENFSRRIRELSSLLSEVCVLIECGTDLGATSIRDAMVFTGAALPITRADIISRRRDIHINNTPRFTFIGRSWDWQDHVDGHVLQ